MHIGSKTGFVDDGLLIFEGRKTADYHDEMDANVFETWFRNILKKLPDNSVIVMDNASYHSRKKEKIPTSSSRKADMQEWLLQKAIPFDPSMVRLELLEIINRHRENHNIHVVDEMAKQSNKIVLRLPPYHCDLNPIELVWAQIKNEVASKNKMFKLAEVKELLLSAIANVTSEVWMKCEHHIIKEEDKMCNLDGLIDDVMEPFIISLENGDSSDSDFRIDTDSDSVKEM